MTPASVYTLFFSPTCTSARTADAIAAALARDTAQPAVSAPVRRIDLPHGAAAPVTLPPDAVAVIAVPVYGPTRQMIWPLTSGASLRTANTSRMRSLTFFRP